MNNEIISIELARKRVTIKRRLRAAGIVVEPAATTRQLIGLVAQHQPPRIPEPKWNWKYPWEVQQ